MLTASLKRASQKSLAFRSKPIVTASRPNRPLRYLSTCRGSSDGTPDLNMDNMRAHHFDHGNHAEQEWTLFHDKIPVLQKRKPKTPSVDSFVAQPHPRQEWTLFHDKIPVLRECDDSAGDDEEASHHSQQEWTTFAGKLPVLRAA